MVRYGLQAALYKFWQQCVKQCVGFIRTTDGPHLHKPRHRHSAPVSHFIYQLCSYVLCCVSLQHTTTQAVMVCVTLEPHYNCSFFRIKLCQVGVRALNLPSIPIMRTSTS